jgi:hypothetical protein
MVSEPAPKTPLRRKVSVRSHAGNSINSAIPPAAQTFLRSRPFESRSQCSDHIRDHLRNFPDLAVIRPLDHDAHEGFHAAGFSCATPGWDRAASNSFGSVPACSGHYFRHGSSWAAFFVFPGFVIFLGFAIFIA